MSERILMPASKDFLIMSEGELKSMWVAWYPDGSGDFANKHICSLIEALATSRGFDITSWESY